MLAPFCYIIMQNRHKFDTKTERGINFFLSQCFLWLVQVLKLCIFSIVTLSTFLKLKFFHSRLDEHTCLNFSEKSNKTINQVSFLIPHLLGVCNAIKFHQWFLYLKRIFPNVLIDRTLSTFCHGISIQWSQCHCA